MYLPNMKKLTISFLILFTFVCHLSAQLPTTWYQHNVSLGTTSYSIQGYKAVSQKVHNKTKWVKGRTLNWYEYPKGFECDYQAIFNSKGLITSKCYYRGSKLSDTKGKYRYNKRNQLVTFVRHTPGDVHASSNEYSYDAQGRMVQHTYGYDIMSTTNVAYNNGWRLIEYMSYDKTNAHGQVTHFVKETTYPRNNYKYTNEYSHKGLLIKHTWEKDIYSETAKGKVWQRTITINEPISERQAWKRTIPKEEPIFRYAYTYKKVYTFKYTCYNKRGDWTKATVYLDGTPYMFLERKITY